MSKFALIFLFIFFGGIVVAFAYHGAAAFMVYQFIYFFNPDFRWWGGSIPGLRYSMISVLLMIFVLALRYREYSMKSPWSEMVPLKWLVALLCFYYLGYLYAIDISAHDRFTFEFTKLVIIIFVAYKLINSEQALDLCLWVYILGCTYIGYLAYSAGRNSQGRVEGIGMVDAPDANDTAAVLVPTAALLMYFAWTGSKKVKFIAVVCGAFIANALVLINSRGAFLAGVVSLGIFVFYMIFSKYQRKGQKLTAIVIVCLGIGGALYVTDDLFWSRMSTLQNIEDSETSGSSRMEFWWTTFDMLEDRPMGLGVGGYNRLAPIYMDDDTRGGVEYRSVHSMWFQGLSEVGWLGFLCFCFMLLTLKKLTIKTKKFLVAKKDFDNYFKVIALEASLIGYLVAGTFINRFRAEVLYWLILFLAVAVNVLYLRYVRDRQVDVKTPKSRLRRLKGSLG